MYAVKKVINGMILGVLVAVISGAASMAVGARYAELNSPSNYSPPAWHSSVLCPTESDCVWGWDGQGYGYMPLDG